jgi:hypothetical protein
MRRIVRLLCLGTVTLGAAVAAAGPAQAAADPAPQSDYVPAEGFTAAQLQQQMAAGVTLKTWTRSIASFGRTFTYTMVGKDPFTRQSNPVTNVPTELIPVELEFADGSTTDATAADPACLSQGSANSLTKASPVFADHHYVVGGTDVGSVQYVDGFQRENFAKFVLAAGAINPTYHVNVALLNDHLKAIVKVPAADGVTTSARCGIDGVSIDWWKATVQNKLLPAIANFVTPHDLPVFLFYRTNLFRGAPPAGIGGFHTAVSNPAFGGVAQTYVTADFKPSGDVSTLTHEVGEWMDDPFTHNPVPAWGHIGQQSGCQTNLEVGDPLSGTRVAVTMPNGFTYHAQELAFFSWFYRQNPSLGLHGWFSSNGTFTSDAGPLCS